MMTDMTDLTHMTALMRILSERIILFAGRLVCGVAATLLRRFRRRLLEQHDEVFDAGVAIFFP